MNKIEKFFNEIKGLENELEGGKRCFLCYKLRLRYTASVAKTSFERILFTIKFMESFFIFPMSHAPSGLV